jgi:hypothetical protein
MKKKLILSERLARIDDLRKRSGKLGTVSPALAQFLLGVTRMQMRRLFASQALETVGVGGLRLVPVEGLLKYARRCARRVRTDPATACLSVTKCNGCVLGTYGVLKNYLNSRRE